jgi:excinuclease UvrABC helicase subunit UvrB
MDPFNKTIDRIVNAIDWKKIKDYHKRLNILWEFTEDKQIVQRVPTITELRNELRSIIFYMNEENLDYISYGSWVLFWDKEKGEVGDIRVIFRLADFHFEENANSVESLEDALQKALEKEDYESAAAIRDTLQKKKKEM